jgi:tetratricopeptide (TPR) repeat protein
MESVTSFWVHSRTMKARGRRAPIAAAARKAGAAAPAWLLLAALLAATFAAYQPAWHGGLLWDDEAHATRPELRPIEGLARIWAEPGATQQYYPLLHSTFWVLHRLLGGNTLPYHLLSIGLHALSAFLFGLILRRLAVPWPWLAAFVFALHPVHVESVAWITELKNTQSGVFFLASALAYLRFDESRRTSAWLLAFLLFGAALLSKSVTATLPALLLVVLWWRRGRLDLRRDVTPLLPFFTAAAASGAFTVWAERTLIGARGSGFEFSLADRVLIAGRAVWFYLGKLLWPANLTFIYPRWTIDASAWWQYLYPLALLALAGGLWMTRARSRAPVAALACFCIALSPALGFVNVYPFRFSFVADHFQYLASLGIIALVCGGLAWLVAQWPSAPRWTPLATAALIVLPLGMLTHAQSRDYADAETLYRATIARDPQSWMAHNNLAVLMLQTAPEEALAHLDQALRANPGYPEAHNNRGLALQLLDRFEEAAAAHGQALRLEPTFAEAHNNLGTALQKLNRLPEAEAAYREALRLRPESLQARVNLGNVLLETERVEEAATHYRAALAIDPGLADVHFTLGAALERSGRPDEAAAEYRETLHLQPASADAHARLGTIAEAEGRLDEATTHYDAWSTLDPASPAALLALGNARYRAEEFARAASAYGAAVALAPDSADARNNYGAALERLGHIDEAAAQYAEAVRLAPDSAGARANLARTRK